MLPCEYGPRNEGIGDTYLDAAAIERRVLDLGAQITRNYALGDLPGRLVLAVVNFPPRQIGPVMSEVLVLGVPDAEGEVMLIAPDRDVPLGGRLY